MGLFFSSFCFDQNTDTIANAFIVIMRCHIKSNTNVEDYIDLSVITNKEVMNNEPGVLHHMFEQDPADYCSFVWSQIFINENAFLNHINNIPFKKFIEQHNEMGDDLRMEIYGTVSDKTKTICDELPFIVEYFDTHLGYSRIK